MVDKPAVGHGVHPPAFASSALDPEDWDSQAAGGPGSVWWLVVWLAAMLLAAGLSYAG